MTLIWKIFQICFATSVTKTHKYLLYARVRIQAFLSHVTVEASSWIDEPESVGRVVCITAMINIMSLYPPPQCIIFSIFTCIENKGGNSICEWGEGRGGGVKPELSALFKDVRAHCYCASLVRTLFIRHARATSFSSACTESKTQQKKSWWPLR